MKKSVAFFALFSIVASALNYIIYPLLARLLPANDYVDITVALSLFTQISAYLSSIIAITIGISKKHPLKAAETISQLQLFLLKSFLVLASILMLLSPILLPPLHVQVQFIIPICLMMIFSIPITIISGYLNGLNAMTKLGSVALVSATSQFVVALCTAAITHNAFATMLSMVVAQMLTVAILYKSFSSMSLPRLLPDPKAAGARLITRRLKVYTLFAALSIMAISLAQVADLLLIRKLYGVDAKFYTDIYVISRVVFFAGMILIWPFLGSIKTSILKNNIKPYVTLVGLFVAMGLAASVALWTGGQTIASILFGESYGPKLIGDIGFLSVMFKVFMLIITATVLYYVVLHRATAIVIASWSSVLVICYGLFLNVHASIASVLLDLNYLLGGTAVICVSLVIFEAYYKKTTS